MGPDISVMWDGTENVRYPVLYSLGSMKTAVCCRCQEISTLTEPGSVENLRLQHRSLSRSAQNYTS
jgi:hypothetical protein